MEDLLEISKASTGNIAIVSAPCELEVLLEQALGEYEAASAILTTAQKLTAVKLDVRGHALRVMAAPQVAHALASRELYTLSRAVAVGDDEVEAVHFEGQGFLVRTGLGLPDRRILSGILGGYFVSPSQRKSASGKAVMHHQSLLISI
jgi:hypothetical protein